MNLMQDNYPMETHTKPFSLDDDAAYRAWREYKLALPPRPEMIEIDRPEHLTDAQLARLAQDCADHNFALFRFNPAPADPQTALKKMGAHFGLRHIDANLCAEDSGLTEITVKDTATDNRYIPYTDRPIGWHTDGYYNPMDHQIHGMLLYCQQPAAEGGINGLMDHDIAYIRLRDQNPGWIRALMAGDAFTIPPNTEGGVQIRPATVGPVFSVSPDGTRLHMRYSARQRNVIWKDDPLTLEAAAALLELLNEDDPFVLTIRLAPGEGVLSNNILHKRSGFTDSSDPTLKRVMFRARYYDPVTL
jgi:alpha-ketoglutarate-dependent taurine dioxygenase